MNLADPTIGDLVDRLSILSIRAQYLAGTSAAEALAVEFTALRELLGKKLAGTAWHQTTGMTELIVKAAELGAINGRLWEVHERPGELPLIYAMELNAHRRKVVEEIG